MPLRRALVVGLSCALVAACTPQPPEPTVSVPPTVPATAPSDINAQDRATLKAGGLVRLRLTTLPGEWNPRHPDGDQADVRAVTAPLTAPAFVTDAAGRATANEDVIRKVEVTTNDATQVILTLNPAARWGDGAPVTAADWIATWRANTGQISGVNPVRTAGWERVAEVKQGEGATHVVIDYTGPDPAWTEPLVAGPLRAITVSDADTFSWDGFEAGHYAGPYTVTHVDATQGVITLEPNPHWWGDPTLLNQVIFRTLPDDAAPAAFRNNELDLLAVGVSAQASERVEGDPTSSLRRSPSPTGRLLQIDHTGPLADERLRRAVLMSLDRRAIGKADLTGIDTTPSVWSDPLLLPNQPGYADQAKATGLTRDREQANALLDQAGWLRGDDGLRSRNGEPLTLTFAVDDGLWSTRELKHITGALAAVGITVTPVSTGADLTPATTTASAFPLAHLPKVAWSDDSLAEYATKISQEMDPIRRADQANQLSRLLWQRLDTIPLFQPSQLVAVRTGLANVGSGGFASTSWEDVGWQA
ncbi:MAG: ABC transporter substrate-binding protein [Propioniciclava sp.]